MKKLIFIFIALSLLVGAPFAGASKDAGLDMVEPFQAQDPVPDEPGVIPRLVGGHKGDQPLIATYPDGYPKSTESAAATEINLWYGGSQNFGQLGNPQQWVNVLGKVTADAGVQSLTYSLNGGPDQSLSVGEPFPRGNDRLVQTGDFNVEIDRALLSSGANTIVLKGVDGNGQPIPQKNVTVNYTPNQTWAESYDAKWSTAASIQEVAQIVDGNWGISNGKLVTKEVGYDRLVAIGDIGDAASKKWTDYEVTVPITVKSLNVPSGYENPSNGPGIGVILRWQGHTSKNGDQPRLEWRERVGAIGWYRWDKSGNEGLEILGGNGWRMSPVEEKKWELGTTYMVKMSVQSPTDPSDTRAYYRLKFWKQGSGEPGAWDIEGYSNKNNTPSGSVLLVAHEADAEFGDVKIRPLKDLSFKLTTSANGNGTVTVDGFPPVPDKIYAYGTKVTLRGNPAANHYLESWSGDLNVSGTVNPLSINMTKDMAITANFKEAAPGNLTVNVTPPGAGSVTLDPPPPGGEYPGGILVKLTAVPAPGYLFKDWSGAASGTVNPTTVRIDGNKTVTANFAEAGNASPISDNFNRCELNTSLWTYVDPSGKGARAVNEGVLELTAPADPTMTLYNTDRNAPRVMQTTEDQDFDVVIKFNSVPDGRNQIQGFLVQQDANNWIRFDIFQKNGLKLFAGVTTNDVTSSIWNESVSAPGATEVYMRVTRVGDTWSQAFSTDGTTWQAPQQPKTFEKALTVNSTGIYAGNQNNTDSPSFTAKVDYFKNLAFPAGASGYELNVSVNGNGTVQLSPEPDENGRYGCNAQVTLTAVPENPATGPFTGWSGSLSGTQNPATLTMNADKNVTAFFGGTPVVGACTQLGSTQSGVCLPVVLFR